MQSGKQTSQDVYVILAQFLSGINRRSLLYLRSSSAIFGETLKMAEGFQFENYRSFCGIISRVTTNCEKSAEPIVARKFLEKTRFYILLEQVWLVESEIWYFSESKYGFHGQYDAVNYIEALGLSSKEVLEQSVVWLREK